MILREGEVPRPKSLPLSTATGWTIPNYQIGEISSFEQSQFGDLDRRFGTSTIARCESTALYNCHGMTFASRRTGIFDSDVLQRILADDKYVELQTKDVLPGDVLLYVSDDGDIEHSAVVVESPSAERLGIPRVVSKWGKYREVLHWANDCPYSFAGARYFRVRHA